MDEVQYYECRRCKEIRILDNVESYSCPGCYDRNCKHCRCSQKGSPGCPAAKLSYEEYEVYEEVHRQYIIEEPLDTADVLSSSIQHEVPE